MPSDDKRKDGKCGPKKVSGHFLITPLVKGCYPTRFNLFWAPPLRTSAGKYPPGFFPFCLFWLEPKAVGLPSLTSGLSEGWLIGIQEVDLLLMNIALEGHQKSNSPAALLPGAQPWHKATKLQPEKCTSLKTKILSPPLLTPYTFLKGLWTNDLFLYPLQAAN